MKVFAFVIALAMVTMLVDGCSYTESGPSIGQRLDRALAHTSSALVEAGGALGVGRLGADASVDGFASTLSDRALLSALAVTDAGIAASIRTEMVKDPEFGATKIGIDTRDGVVTLNGSADNECVRRRAEQIARSNKDVVRVDNLLTLRQL